ncbi:MAG: hypothetical protein J2P45_06385, partial [Candidatus Dormibacteraeota bacterium]|nr:hypothetical protein [Candidatus Dormibacteraeota bacterium]
VVGFLALIWPFNRMVLSRAEAVGEVGASELNGLTLIPAYVSLAVVLALGVWLPGPLHDLLAGAVRVLNP